MKNVALVFFPSQNGVALEHGKAFIEEFPQNGYSFSEVKFLCATEDESAVECISALEESDNIAVFSDGERVSAISQKVSSMKKIALAGDGLGSGILSDGEKTAFFISLQDKEYVKKICIPYLNSKYSTRYERAVIRAVGASPNQVSSLIAKAKGFGGEWLSFRSRFEREESIVEIFYDGKAPKLLIDDVMRLFVEGLGETVYALDDTPLEVQLVRLLKLRKKKISLAESFTGGGIAKKIVSVSGASEVYFEGLNTYSEQSKSLRLGVSDYTLNTFGAVSDATAYEMAAGLLQTGYTDIAIATTGLAGPNSDRSELPVGLSYIAVGTKEKIFVYRYKLDGTREEITEKAITYAIFPFFFNSSM